MKVWFFIGTVILVGGLFQSAGSVQNYSELSRPQQIKAQVEKSFLLGQHRSTWEWLIIVQSVIHKANPKLVGLGQQQVNVLSRDTVRISQCYGIDPGVFSALVWRESNFKPTALSKTGAVGLTQMTQSGVKEVLERISSHSPRHLKYLRARVKKCDPKIYDHLPAVVSADTVASFKNRVMTSPTYGLVFGALLLKINLAHVKVKNKYNTRDLYRQALEKYNGDAKVKVQFAMDVLQLERRLVFPAQIALSDSKFLKSVLRF